MSKASELLKLLQEQTIPKVSKSKVKYRVKDFDTAKCGVCRYFKDKLCDVVEGDIDPEFVCNAVNMKDRTTVLYDVKPKDREAFIKGMVKDQPYQHNVIDGINTPKGWLLIIKDTMKPKPHIFSIDFDFSRIHTSREHGWTQGEVDRLIKSGKK